VGITPVATSACICGNSRECRKAAYVGVQIFRMGSPLRDLGRLWRHRRHDSAVTTGWPTPNVAYWTHSGNLVFMAVLGGSGTFAGPAIGALVFVVLQDS